MNGMGTNIKFHIQMSFSGYPLNQHQLLIIFLTTNGGIYIVIIDSLESSNALIDFNRKFILKKDEVRAVDYEP